MTDEKQSTEDNMQDITYFEAIFQALTEEMGRDERVILIGEDRVIPGTVLRMTFASVVEDSRCPSDVVCVWEGNATVEVGIGTGTGPTFPLQLNTSLDPRSVEWNDVLVTLLALTPDPVSDSAITPADYAVTLRLEPMG